MRQPVWVICRIDENNEPKFHASLLDPKLAINEVQHLNDIRDRAVQIGGIPLGGPWKAYPVTNCLNHFFEQDEYE